MRERNASPCPWIEPARETHALVLDEGLGNATISASLAQADDAALDGFDDLVQGALAAQLSGLNGVALPGQASNMAMQSAWRAARGGRDEGLALDVALGEMDASSGAPLPACVRERMERAFGRPLDHVRLHTGPRAGAAAMALNARAFAVGGEIYLGRGAPAPGTRAGDALLAHELTHVLQHDEGRLPPSSGGMTVSSPSDAHEREAVAVGARVSQALADEGARAADGDAFGDLVGYIDGLLGASGGGAAPAEGQAATVSREETTSQAAGAGQAGEAQGAGQRAQDAPPTLPQVRAALVVTDAEIKAPAALMTQIKGPPAAGAKAHKDLVVNIAAARTYNTDAHTISFLRQLRALLAAAATSESSAGGGATAGPAAAPEVAQDGSAAELKAAVVDVELVRLIVAWQLLHGGSADGRIGDGTYGSLIAAWPELEYPEPRTEQGLLERADPFELLSEADLYAKLALLVAQRYGLFFEDPYFVNLVGIRGLGYRPDAEGGEASQQANTNPEGSWSDTIVALYADHEGNRHVRRFQGTADPDTYTHGVNGKSTNFLAEGQHAYVYGQHKGYAALNLASTGKVGPGHRRDAEGDFDLYLGRAPGAPQGDNIHTTHTNGAAPSSEERDATVMASAGSFSFESGTGQSAQRGSTGQVWLPTPLWRAIDKAIASGAQVSVAVEGDPTAPVVSTPAAAAPVRRRLRLSAQGGAALASGPALIAADAALLGGLSTPVKIVSASSGADQVPLPTKVTVTTPGGPKSTDEPGSHWSQGCTVVRGTDRYADLMELIEAGRANGQQVFPYTILDATALVRSLGGSDLPAETVAEGEGPASATA